MKKLLSIRLAGNTLLLALGCLALFHIAVLAGFAPADMVWGGQAEVSATRLQVMESIALIATLGLVGLIYMRLKDIGTGRMRKGVTVGIWLLFGFFLLNTAGNLASTTSLETWIFTPVTVLLAICALRLAVEK